jgi:hypothetical protein
LRISRRFRLLLPLDITRSFHNTAVLPLGVVTHDKCALLTTKMGKT